MRVSLITLGFLMFVSSCQITGVSRRPADDDREDI